MFMRVQAFKMWNENWLLYLDIHTQLIVNLDNSSCIGESGEENNDFSGLGENWIGEIGIEYR